MISGQSTARIEELLLEDQNVKRRRERFQKQSSLLSKLTRQLGIHDNRAAAASSWSNGSTEAGELNVVSFFLLDRCNAHIWPPVHDLLEVCFVGLLCEFDLAINEISLSSTTFQTNNPNCSNKQQCE